MAKLSDLITGGLRLQYGTEPLEVIRKTGGDMFLLLIPLLSMSLSLALLSSFLQGGFVLKSVEMDMERINPVVSNMPPPAFEDIQRDGLMMLKKATMAIFITFFSIAIIDFIFEKLRFERSLRMTRQELKEEFRETDDTSSASLCA